MRASKKKRKLAPSTLIRKLRAALRDSDILRDDCARKHSTISKLLFDVAALKQECARWKLERDRAQSLLEQNPGKIAADMVKGFGPA